MAGCFEQCSNHPEHSLCICMIEFVWLYLYFYLHNVFVFVFASKPCSARQWCSGWESPFLGWNWSEQLSHQSVYQLMSKPICVWENNYKHTNLFINLWTHQSVSDRNIIITPICFKQYQLMNKPICVENIFVNIHFYLYIFARSTFERPSRRPTYSGLFSRKTAKTSPLLVAPMP